MWWFFTSRHWCDCRQQVAALERPKQLLDNFKFVILVCLSWKVQKLIAPFEVKLKRQSKHQMLTAAYEKKL